MREKGAAVDHEILSFNHPMLAKVYSIEESGADTVITMERVGGMNLQDYLKLHKRLSSKKAAAVMADLCDALSYLHDYGSGYLYMDMKPSNVMITETGEIKLVDLDTCISRQRATDRNTFSCLHGTRGFAAPEQYNGNYPVDVRADIYSLGVTIYALMTERDPSQVSDGEFDIKKVRPLADGDLCRIVQKCTRVNPDGRYKDIKELQYELRQIL